jgi:nucleotide-binding universal stress UspA family protein
MNRRAVRNILLHLDTTDVSEEAARHARVLAQAFDATVHVLHIPGEPLSASWTSEVDAARLPEVHEAMAAEARERLAGIFSQADQERARLTLAIETGAAAEALIRYAEAHAIDLVVIGSRGYAGEGGGLDDIAREVVERVRASVFLVRPR